MPKSINPIPEKELSKYIVSGPASYDTSVYEGFIQYAIDNNGFAKVDLEDDESRKGEKGRITRAVQSLGMDWIVRWLNVPGEDPEAKHGGTIAFRLVDPATIVRRKRRSMDIQYDQTDEDDDFEEDDD